MEQIFQAFVQASLFGFTPVSATSYAMRADEWGEEGKDFERTPGVKGLMPYPHDFEDTDHHVTSWILKDVRSLSRNKRNCKQLSQ